MPGDDAGPVIWYGIWYGTVIEVNDDELTLDLRRDGSPDLFAEVSASRWQLDDAVIGDTLVLDTEAQTVNRLGVTAWTQEELDDIATRARERYEQLMKCFDE